jgi:3alpha(or 20beta)-hydroxysteroid dehydrogenase
MRAVVPSMQSAGGGSIVNLSSSGGMQGYAQIFSYVASKWAVRGMTKAAAIELAPLGIRVNSVHPGGVMTQMAMAAAASFNTMDAEAFVKAMPIPRFAEPIEISRLVAFLASDEASYSTGSEFTADGGILSGPGY